MRDRYRQITVTLDDGLSLVMRAYDDGIAYRLATDVDRTVRIDTEEVWLRFPGEPVLYAPLADRSKSTKNGVDQGWGVTGVMVDFMDRDDQPTVRFCERVARETAKSQAAMYLVYESPYAKMGGEREPEFTRFVASIPTLWTDTHAIDGRLADYVVVLREATDGSWWVGALTDWTSRELALPLAFLPDGTFTAEIWQDGPNAARYAADWQHVGRQVSATDTLAIRMAPRGGWVARIK